MLRATSNKHGAARMPRKKHYMGYHVNLNPQVSPHITNKKIQQEEVYNAKTRTLSVHMTPYFGDKLGKRQMQPQDLRKEGRIYQHVGYRDIDKAVLRVGVFGVSFEAFDLLVRFRISKNDSKTPLFHNKTSTTTF